MRIGSLFTGYGGIEAGIMTSSDEPWTIEFKSEINKSIGGKKNNLGDITTIDSAPEVDLITAGFPCQPISIAGEGKGVADKRWLIDDTVRVANLANAEMIFLENVAAITYKNRVEEMDAVRNALITGGFSRFGMGVLRASNLGACHQRARWFCLAVHDLSDLNKPDDFYVPANKPKYRLLPTPAASLPNDGETVEAWKKRRDRNLEKGYNGNGQGTPLSIAARLPEEWHLYEKALQSHERMMETKRPDHLDSEGRLSVPFVEWMMGLPSGWIGDLKLARKRALSILGNGAAPFQVQAAWNLLRGESWK